MGEEENKNYSGSHAVFSRKGFFSVTSLEEVLSTRGSQKLGNRVSNKSAIQPEKDLRVNSTQQQSRIPNESCFPAYDLDPGD
jgi:hypothetical protein